MPLLKLFNTKQSPTTHITYLTRKSFDPPPQHSQSQPHKADNKESTEKYKPSTTLGKRRIFAPGTTLGCCFGLGPPFQSA